MKYKMLVVDMDDTLLTDDHNISNENKEMLLKAQEIILMGRRRLESQAGVLMAMIRAHPMRFCSK